LTSGQLSANFWEQKIWRTICLRH